MHIIIIIRIHINTSRPIQNIVQCTGENICEEAVRAWGGVWEEEGCRVVSGKEVSPPRQGATTLDVYLRLQL